MRYALASIFSLRSKMDPIKKRLKKRQKEYEEIEKEILPPFDYLAPKKIKKKKKFNFLT